MARRGCLTPALVALLLGALGAGACSSATYRVASHANAYAHFEREYELACGQNAPKPIPAGCKDYYTGVVAYKADLFEANEALKREGSIKYQERQLRADLKRVKRGTGK